jgi:dTDP-4-amino-4,6-dideoxygalactose transaminase
MSESPAPAIEPTQRAIKQRVEELAVCGGTPAFTEELCVGRPNLGDRTALMNRIERMLDSRWLTNHGPLVQEFETRVAEFLGVKHCVAVCNATVGLEIAIRALELRGEVIVPSFTFVATAHALQWLGLTPIFCDVDPVTHTIDPKRVEELITPRTSGIVGVHLWGQPCAIEELTEICERYELTLLFDAAHAFGCSHQGQMIGGFGDVEVFSFHATKFFNSFEGGAITTNDDALARRIRLMQNFGFAGYDEVVSLGTNGKMPEVSAAMGLTSLESVDHFVAVNRRNYLAYRDEVATIPGVRLFEFKEAEKNNFQYIVFEVDEAESGLGRDDLVTVLWAENVKARRYFYPGCHRMEPYQSLYPEAAARLPITERLTQRTLLLPNGEVIGPDEVNAICAIIRTAIRNGAEIKRHLASGS